MTLAPQATLALALVAACASAGLYLASLRGTPATQTAGVQPDLYVDQPRWTLFNERGEREKQLHARRLEQWPQQEAALLIEPRIELHDQRQRTWQLSARSGRVFPDQRPIQLEDTVLLEGRHAQSTFRAETSRLQVARNGDRVETGAPVVLRTGNWHFSAVGLRADLGRQYIELLEQVKGTHE